MKITIITLFPEVIFPYINTSMLRKAQEKKKVEYEILDLRKFGEGERKTVDDRPYGGGIGMVLKANVLAEAVKSARNASSVVILTSPSGSKYDQKIAISLARKEHLIIIAGHYEGVDQRFIDKYVDMEISIGDYVLTGGEIPALVLADSISRLIEGVLKEGVTKNESFENDLLEYPHYTRPEIFEEVSVPKILKSGNHLQIQEWRSSRAIEKTKKIRPDLLKN